MPQPVFEPPPVPVPAVAPDRRPAADSSAVTRFIQRPAILEELATAPPPSEPHGEAVGPRVPPPPEPHAEAVGPREPPPPEPHAEAVGPSTTSTPTVANAAEMALADVSRTSAETMALADVSRSSAETTTVILEPAAQRLAGMRLMANSGPAQGSMFDVGSAGATLGRLPDNSICLTDGRLSRHHARIEFREGGFWLSDLGSQNGTLVNDRPLTETHRLQAGDSIELGTTRLTVILDPNE